MVSFPVSSPGFKLVLIPFRNFDEGFYSHLEPALSQTPLTTMGRSPISLLLFRRLSLVSKVRRPHVLSLHFSTSNLPASKPTSSFDSQAKPTSLSARMSFIFEQIDEIEKQKEEKDQTLQRIRAWRQSKQQETASNLVNNEENRETEGGGELMEAGAVSETGESKDGFLGVEENPERVLDKREGVVKRKEMEVAHPWPEWIELMERLVKQNYFDNRRKDENKMMRELGFDGGYDVVVEDNVADVDFNDFKLVQTACLNFGKDRFDILRFEIGNLDF